MGSIERLRGDAKQLMAGAADGVPLLSNDRGASWKMVSDLFPDLFPYGTWVTSLFQDGSRIWASCLNAYYVSDDSGKTWAQWGEDSMGPVNYDNRGFVDRKLGMLWGGGTSGIEIWDPKTGAILSRGVPDDAKLGFFYATGLATVGKVLFTSGTWGMYHEDAGVFMSADSGKTWQARNAGLPSYYSQPDSILLPYVDSVFALGNVLFAKIVGPGRYLFRSTDLGAHWLPADQGLPGANGYYVYGNRIIASGGSAAWYVSDDTARSWKPWDPGFPGLTGLVFSQTVVFAVHQNDLDGRVDTIHVSRDGMKTWQRLIGPWATSNDLQPNGLFASGRYLLAAYQDHLGNRFWISKDEGLTWGSDSGFIYQESFRLRADIGNTSFKSDSGILLSSSDQWKTWKNSLRAPPSITALMAFGNVLFAVGGDSLYASSDAGESWGKPVLGKGAAQVFGIDTLGGRLYAASERGVWVSRNGRDWSDAGGAGLYSSGLKAMAASGSNLVVSTRQGVFHSSDWGAHWFSSPSPPPSVRTLAYRQGRFFADSWEWGLWSSADSGRTWGLLVRSQNPGEFDPYGQHAGMAAGPEALYMARANNQFMRAIDSNGTKWNAWWGSPAMRGDAWSLARGQGGLYACDAEGAYLTSISGGGWSSIILPGSGPHDFLAGDADRVAVTSSSGIFLRDSSSADWRPAEAGLPNEDATAIALNEGRIFAGLFSKGIWVNSVYPVAVRAPGAKPLLLSDPIVFPGADGSTVFRLRFARPARLRLTLHGTSGRTLASIDQLAQEGLLDVRAKPREHGVAFYRLTIESADGTGIGWTRRGMAPATR